ncbi:hypothetical protein OG244_36810 [Streptomyces brevispora]|nr:hypothetical protein [Streptomyces brevispora]
MPDHWFFAAPSPLTCWARRLLLTALTVTGDPDLARPRREYSAVTRS